MKFIGKLDNPSGEMGITHKGKPEGRLLYLAYRTGESADLTVIGNLVFTPSRDLVFPPSRDQQN